jgi:hypothetical protein
MSMMILCSKRVTYLWSFLNENKLNIVVKWLTLLLHIWEAPGSNLCPETSYAVRFFVVFLSPFRQMLG